MIKQNTTLILKTNSIELLTNEFVTPITNILTEINFNYEIKSIFEDLSKINILKYSNIIITGTALKDFEYEKINLIQIINSINEKKIPIIGICSGAQILSKYFNLDLIKNSQIGIIDLLNQKNNETIKAYALHSKTLSLNNIKEGKVNIDIKLVNNDFQNYIEYCSIDEIFHLFFFHPEIKNKELIKNLIK